MKQRLHLVTGKGGVGKSSVAMAIARDFAAKGRRTLLVELGESSYYELIFGLRPNQKPQPLLPGLHLSLWSGEACLREYLGHLIKVKVLVRLFFENKVMQSFLRSAPGLKELAILGKLTSGIRQWGPAMSYDEVVVDAYATGHFLSLLKAPDGMAEIISHGPMGAQSQAISGVLKNKEHCSYYIVTLPEELPLAEAEELHGDLLGLTRISPKVILNRSYENQSVIESAEHKVLSYLQRLNDKTKKAKVRLRELDPNFVSLPYLHLNDVRLFMDGISQEWKNCQR